MPPDLYFKARLDLNAAKVNAIVRSLDSVSKKKYEDALREEFISMEQHYKDIYPKFLQQLISEVERANRLSYI